MKRSVVLFGLAAAGILCFARGADAGIKEGKWEMTTTVHMDMGDEDEGMTEEDAAMMNQLMGGMGMDMKMGAQGGGMGMSTTMTQCITNDKPVPHPSGATGCEESHRVRGNTIEFKSVCANGTSEGNITYTNETMRGTITSTEKGAPPMTMDITGRYVGPCDASAAATIPGARRPEAMDKNLAIQQKELNLQKRELELQKKELELTASKNTPEHNKSGLDNVNDAINTTNKVSNTIGGLRSLFGR